MPKKCLTYQKIKTQDLACSSVSQLCEMLIADTDIATLKRLCGAMCYSSLFLVADYELEDKKKYTFENVCYHVPGILKLALHDLLENLSNICLQDSDIDITKSILAVLHECLYPEVVSMLKHNVKQTYCTLFYIYCHLVKNDTLKQEVLSMLRNDSINILPIYTYFEREIMSNNFDLTLELK